MSYLLYAQSDCSASSLALGCQPLSLLLLKLKFLKNATNQELPLDPLFVLCMIYFQLDVILIDIRSKVKIQ